MEIAGYPIMGWIILFVGVGVAGYATSWPVIWLLTWRTDGKDRDPTKGLFKYQWVVALAISLIYLVLLGNSVGWKL